jgi:hypothetical protein
MAKLFLQRKKNFYVAVFVLKQAFQLLYGGAKESARHILGARITVSPNGNKDSPLSDFPKNLFCQRGSYS